MDRDTLREVLFDPRQPWIVPIAISILSIIISIAAILNIG